ncbi:hypothetical protein, variant [Cladophialophora immunda]|uniref:NAD-dependent epimerase/dehydratase domain-containing protein n=1 Tax=Cladophialophora immunda TaxID=569365 RepID=A0A0D1ZQA7_9EURO|nr:hypothetical protein, variant [Cladophialophora immunda]KIW30201.1 hypothetical protein, variant [Cladophialophora immunda]
MARILLTGATGYIGGETLHQLATSGAKYAITCLVRPQKASLIARAYPSVRIAEGDLDDVEIVEKEASEADIVIHLASTKHVPSCNAIIRGLSTTGRSAPGYWIQMSGASLFSAEEIKSDTYGEAAGKFYDNLKDADEIRSIISSSPSRVVDNLVLAQQPSSIKTALVVGPLIYGRGRGPGNTRSIQGPESAKYTLQQGQGFRLSAGKSVWSNVHVRDVGSLICLLVSAATAKKEGIWNQDGIYLPENGHMAFGDLTALIAKEAHRQGFIQSPTVEKVINPADGDEITPHAAILLGTNAKLVESRARRDLGWQPSGFSLEDEVADMVTREAKDLGLEAHM